MPEFAYTARNNAGHDVAGMITAATRREALCALGDRQLFPLKVEDAAPPRIGWQPKRRIKTALLATTLTQLADLLQSGVPLLRSLDVLAEQAVHPQLAEVLDDVRNQVAEGTPLDEAMARAPAGIQRIDDQHGAGRQRRGVSGRRAEADGRFPGEARRTARQGRRGDDLSGNPGRRRRDRSPSC